jgi:D-alanyl-D-alanine carboxypeptidase (penicillin-binding protein 5/6)
MVLALALCVHFTLDVAAMTARGAIAICFDTGEDIFTHNADIPQAPASMVKMMAVYLAYDAMDAGVFTADCVVPISHLAYTTSQQTGQTNVRLTRTGRYTVSQLLDVIIVVSAGGATIALAEFIGGGSLYNFMQKANDKVDEWGIHAYFQAPHGGTLPTFMSPRAMAELTRNTILRFPQVLERTGVRAVNFHGRRFTNPMPTHYPGMDGFKTGSNPVARYNYAGTAQRDGMRVITVVMGSSTPDNRFTETARLLDYSFERITERREAEAAAQQAAYDAAWAWWATQLYEGDF